MPLSQLLVVMAFHCWMYVDCPGRVGFRVNSGELAVVQPLRNGLFGVPPVSSVIVPSSGMSDVVTVAPLAANCGDMVYVTEELPEPFSGRLSVPLEMLKSGTVFTVPS